MIHRAIFLASILTLTLSVSGCANVPPEQLPADYDFGKPPSGYEPQVEAYFDTILRDPKSARYEYANGFVQVVCHTFELRGTPRRIKHAGWGRVFTVNAKNAYGGYVGAEEYIALFEGDTLWKVLDYGKFSLEGCSLL